MNRRMTAKTKYIHLDGTVEKGPDLPFATASHCMVTLHDGRVMVLSEEGVAFFDPRSNTFSNGPTLLHKRYGHACTLFYSPMHANRPVILIAGGSAYHRGRGYHLGISELLDYTQNNATWVKGKFLHNSFTIRFL